MEIPGEWTFRNHGVADAFDQHVREQLPWYDLLTATVRQVARHYIEPGGTVYDLGASTGNIARALADILESRAASLVSVEASQEMADRYSGPGELRVEDVRDTTFDPCSLCVCFLVLMFLPCRDRRELIDDMLEALEPGGAVIIVDKGTPPAGYPGVITSRLTMAAKLDQGASPEDILRKELSLAGVQRPLAASDLPEGAVEFFRFGDFFAVLIEKPRPQED